jgi:hypothetical protein
MITAAEVLERHPQGCWVFDATGRQLKHVHACDPDTGEVIMVDWRPTLWQQITSRLRRSSRWNWLTLRSHVPTRHGFWPAPLHIVPKPVWPGGPVPDGQTYIVGNGEPEAHHP